MKILAFILSFSAISAFAGFSSNLTLTSDYVWRGQTQTEHGAAIQGGLDYAHDIGLYAGAWMSNTATENETDLYVGYSKSINDDLSFKVQYLTYQYPYTGGMNTNEYTLGLSFKMIDFSFNYSDDMLGTDTSTMYFTLGGSVEVQKNLSLGINLGYFMFDDEEKADCKNYLDYKVSLTHSKDGFDIAANYSDTNRENYAGDEQDDAAYFISISRAFE